MEEFAEKISMVYAHRWVGVGGRPTAPGILIINENGSFTSTLPMHNSLVAPLPISWYTVFPCRWSELTASTHPNWSNVQNRVNRRIVANSQTHSSGNNHCSRSLTVPHGKIRARPFFSSFLSARSRTRRPSSHFRRARRLRRLGR